MGRARIGPRGGVYVMTRSGNKRYLNINSQFCGPAGGAKAISFPVSTEKQCRAALSYARWAPNPCGIRACALAKAKEKGWRCGVSKPKDCKCGCALNK